MTRRILWALSFLVFAACEATPPAPVATTIQVSLPVLMLQAGSSTTATAVVRDQHGQPMTSQAVTWSSSDASLATISSSGEITAVAAGEVTIRATAGQAEGVAGLTITHDPDKVARVVISPDSAVVLLGQEQTFTAKVFNALDQELTGRTIAWSSSDPRIAGLHSQGIATAINAGKARIIATVEGVSASVPFQARVHPLKKTSYENAKESGASPIAVPKNLNAGRARGDFARTGELGLFVGHAVVDFDAKKQYPSEYVFYRADQSNNFVPDDRVSIDYAGVSPCLSPRKPLVADFNGDKLPDLFLLCHGDDYPPFPGERNQILLSTGGGRYRLQYASPDSSFWHGGSAADLDGDGDIDVIVADGKKFYRFINNGEGSFTKSADAVPTWTGRPRPYYSVELADVDEDGKLDLIAGGQEHWEWSPAPTSIWLNPGNNDFSAVHPIIVDAVQGEGNISDFVLTGTGATRTLWVMRTSGGDGTFYEGSTLQRFNVRARTSEVVVKRRPGNWVIWLLQYERAGRKFVGSDDTKIPLEVEIQ